MATKTSKPKAANSTPTNTEAEPPRHGEPAGPTATPPVGGTPQRVPPDLSTFTFPYRREVRDHTPDERERLKSLIEERGRVLDPVKVNPDRA